MATSHGDPWVHYDCLICSIPWLQASQISELRSATQEGRNIRGTRWVQGNQAGADTGRWEGSLSVAQHFSQLPWAGTVMALAFPGGWDSAPSTLTNLVSSHQCLPNR